LVKVKICGLTNLDDLFLAEELGADYLGFIMYPPSPRYVGEGLKGLLEAVSKAQKVVVFVNPTYEEVKKALDLGADLIQLHGSEDLEFARKIGLKRVIKAFRVKEGFDLEGLRGWGEAYAILLDTYKEGLPGGTGETFNWEIARGAVLKGYRIFLAGGLKPENVLEAIQKVSPYAIDLSSGLEKAPGKKDPAKLKELFQRLKGVNHPFSP